MSIEAMKQALEAMDRMEKIRDCQREIGFPLSDADKLLKKAITSLRQAIEQVENPEPVATMWQHGETGRTRISTPDSITDCDARWFKISDLYPSPPQRQPWVGLTNEDKQIAFDDTQEGGGFWEFADAIEATLRKKNHG